MSTNDEHDSAEAAFYDLDLLPECQRLLPMLEWGGHQDGGLIGYDVSGLAVFVGRPKPKTRYAHSAYYAKIMFTHEDFSAPGEPCTEASGIGTGATVFEAYAEALAGYRAALAVERPAAPELTP